MSQGEGKKGRRERKGKNKYGSDWWYGGGHFPDQCGEEIVTLRGVWGRGRGVGCVEGDVRRAIGRGKGLQCLGKCKSGKALICMSWRRGGVRMCVCVDMKVITNNNSIIVI